jgi:DNA gyrase subunit A
VLSRNTQGVRLIKLKADETLVGIEQVAEPEEALDIIAADIDSGSDAADEAASDE